MNTTINTSVGEWGSWDGNIHRQHTAFSCWCQQFIFWSDTSISNTWKRWGEAAVADEWKTRGAEDDKRRRWWCEVKTSSCLLLGCTSTSSTVLVSAFLGFLGTAMYNMCQRTPRGPHEIFILLWGDVRKVKKDKTKKKKEAGAFPEWQILLLNRSFSKDEKWNCCIEAPSRNHPDSAEQDLMGWGFFF